MEKVFFNKDGWVCNSYPYNFPIIDEKLYIMVDDEQAIDVLASPIGMAWRVVNWKLKQEIYDETAYQKDQIKKEIHRLKNEIAKDKEDVEQVELFGMQRDDYEQKKARCVEIIERLRVLERQI